MPDYFQGTFVSLQSCHHMTGEVSRQGRLDGCLQAPIRACLILIIGCKAFLSLAIDAVMVASRQRLAALMYTALDKV